MFFFCVMVSPLNCRLLHLFILSPLAVLGLYSCSAFNPGESPSIKGGMVWLVCEDQSLFFPQYGDSTVNLPHLTELAGDGTVFENAFAVSPVCAPSRSSILTGVMPQYMGTQHMRAYSQRAPSNPHTGLPHYSAPAPAGVRAFTEHLRAAGVYCTNQSKEDYNFETPPLAWDDSSPKAHWRNRPQGAAFFSVVNFFGCHESQVWERSSRPCMVDAAKLDVPPLLPDHPDVRMDLATNYCNLQAMDSAVGEVVRQLKADGLYEGTTILFTSDHGGPFPGFKRSTSDAGLRVPLIVKWADGTEAPDRNFGLFSFLDLAPTALNHFGLGVPDVLTGTPILPDARGHEAVFGGADRFDGDLTRQRSVRTRDWRLTRNALPNPSLRLDIPYRRKMSSMAVIDSLSSEGVEPWHDLTSSPAPRFELYEPNTDPWHQLNLAASASRAPLLDSLNALLDDAFPPKLDWGQVPEADMLVAFDSIREANPLAAVQWQRDESGDWTLFHPSPSASFGWRKSNGEAPWRMEEFNASALGLASGDSIYTIAARIGWPSVEQALIVPE